MKKSFLIVLTLVAILGMFSVSAFADTGVVTTGAVETGTWANLGTSGIIAIAVAAVILVAAIVLLVVLSPKKSGTKK